MSQCESSDWTSVSMTNREGVNMPIAKHREEVILLYFHYGIKLKVMFCFAGFGFVCGGGFLFVFFCVLVALLFCFPEGNLCFCCKHCRKLVFIVQNHCIKILRGRSIAVILAVYRYSCKILR